MKNNKKIYILIVSVLTILVLIFMNRKYITGSKESKRLLINEDDFKAISVNLYNREEGYKDIENIEYTNDCVYFSIDEGVRDEKKRRRLEVCL